MTDKCNVYLSGLINKQNFRYWGADNPRNKLVNEIPRSVLKVMVWVAVGWNGITGPYFFENDGRRVTVDQINYHRILAEFYLPELYRNAQK